MIDSHQIVYVICQYAISYLIFKLVKFIILALIITNIVNIFIASPLFM